jgi:hypothetical protein
LVIIGKTSLKPYRNDVQRKKPLNISGFSFLSSIFAFAVASAQNLIRAPTMTVEMSELKLVASVSAQSKSQKATLA